jgi:hypothetical protein
MNSSNRFAIAMLSLVLSGLVHLHGCSGTANDAVDVFADLGADSHDPGCQDPCFGTPETDSPILYVATCSTSGDGSLERPFPDLQMALEAAPEGATILVANGSYSVPPPINKPLSIIGCKDETVLLCGADNTALQVVQTDSVVLKNLVVDKQVTNYSVQIMDSDNVGLSNVKTLESGIYVSASRVDIKDCLVEDAPDTGIVLIGSGTEELKSHVSGSIVSGLYDATVRIFGGAVVLEDNVIEVADPEGLSRPEDNDDAHCISVVANTEGGTNGGGGVVEIKGNTLLNCTRGGIVISEQSDVLITNNYLESPRLGGISIQLSSAVLEDNEIVGAHAFGIAVIHASVAELRNNIISQTVSEVVFDFESFTSLPWAFGIIVRDGNPDGTTTLEGNIVTESELAGVLIDQSTDQMVSFGADNVVAGNLEAGIALQDGAESIAIAQDLENLVSFEFAEKGLVGNGPDGTNNIVSGSTYIGVE